MLLALWHRCQHFFFYLANTLKHRGLAMFAAYLLVQACWLAAFAPLTIVVSESLMSLYGLQGVANQQLLGFFLSPSGYLFAIWLVAMALFNFFLQQGVLTLLLAQHEVNRRSISQAIHLLLRRAWSIAGLAFLQSVLLISICCSLLFVGRWLFGLMLADWDINYYLTMQRSQLWFFLSVLCLGGLPVTFWLANQWLKWWFTLPFCMLQRRTLLGQLRDSTDLAQGQRKWIVLITVIWLALRTLVFVVLVAAFIWLLHVTIDWWDPQQLSNLALVLFSFALLAGGSVLSFLDTWLYACIQFYMFKVLVKQTRGKLANEHQAVLKENHRLHLGFRLLLLASLLLAANEFADEVDSFTQRFAQSSQFSVMGHRAGGYLAEENSLAGLQKSIELGLSMTEIDIQLTADGQIVVVHDRDLGRLTGDPSVVHLSNFAQVQQAFVAAGLPSPQPLSVWLAKSAAQITLNLELKRYDDSLDLVPALLTQLKRYPYPVVVSSLDAELLNYLKQLIKGTPLAARVKTAFIAAASFGESSLLQNADMLMVNQQWVSPWRLLSAQQREQKIYVWTVNRVSEVERMYYLGVDGVITDEPIMALQTIQRLEQLSEVEHLLNGFRYWLNF